MADTLTITDNRTGKKYEIPIQDNTIRAMDLRQIKVNPEDFGMLTYDPAFMNTAACRSRITFIDGDRGILMYRGYPIEQLAEHSDYLETAYLILFGELPTTGQMDQWTQQITRHTMLHENIKKFLEGFRYDAHPMGMFLSAVGALSTFYPDARNIFDPASRGLQTIRLIAKVPSIAAYVFRHTIGRPYVLPDNELRPALDALLQQMVIVARMAAIIRHVAATDGPIPDQVRMTLQEFATQADGSVRRSLALAEAEAAKRAE